MVRLCFRSGRHLVELNHGLSLHTLIRAGFQRVMTTLMVFLLPAVAVAQRSDSAKTSSYIELGAGIGPAVFRDKATSPLFYQGMAMHGILNFLKIADSKETSLGIDIASGISGAHVDEVQVGESIFNSISLWHTRLYQLPGWSDNRWNYMVGGSMITTANLRLNEELQNNSVGFEGFANLMGSFKVSRDVSRLREKHKRLFFINYTLKPRRRSLSYQLNIGVWNNSLRNGYAYLGQSGVVNDPGFLKAYEIQVFSGMRFSSELHYTLHLTGARNNAVRVSYIWDALRTKDGPDAFDMARHAVRFTLLYNTK